MIPIKKQLNTQKTIDDLIKRVNVLSKISGRNGIKVVEGGGGIQLLGSAVSELGQIRMARTTEAAPAATNLTCNLIDSAGDEITSGGEFEVEVYCKISGGGNLNAALPRLANDDYLFVTRLENKWWCVTVFQASEDC